MSLKNSKSLLVIFTIWLYNSTAQEIPTIKDTLF